MRPKKTELTRNKLAVLLVIASITAVFIYQTSIEAKDETTDEVTPVACTTTCDYVQIKDRIYYDPVTMIVHMRNPIYIGRSAYVPYISPNGLPYRYDPKTNRLEMISLQIQEEP